jgi:hypothetical protein
MVRALKTAEDAGFNVKSFKINTKGEIEVEVGQAMAPTTVELASNEWNDWTSANDKSAA